MAEQGVREVTEENTQASFVLELQDVYQRYPDSGRLKTVLNDIDLRVRQGEFVSIVGPTGCGKSTMFRMIAGIEQPASGTLLVDGKPVLGPSRNCGVVFQQYSQFPFLTVLENITFGLRLEAFGLAGNLLAIHRRRIKEFNERAMRYVDQVGLSPDDAFKYPHQLSGGMRQRVAVAQAMIMEPKILLMDEPFGALDPATREVMQLFILDMWQRTRSTVLFVTHDLEEALFVGSRVILMSPHYETDNGSHEGAKIVLDCQTSSVSPKPTDYKYSPECNALMKAIREGGYSSSNKVHIRGFNLRHADSFRTVTPEEWRR
ncbi:MAG: ABC transporter ATP-binding protein [Candidatus Paceibacterota bacterium]|jgi:NitT/TauT family transport system ATP-binding protein